jgi:hypothetical protein
MIFRTLERALPVKPKSNNGHEASQETPLQEPDRDAFHLSTKHSRCQNGSQIMTEQSNGWDNKKSQTHPNSHHQG